MGISQGVMAERGHVDNLCAGHDRDLMIWKQKAVVNSLLLVVDYDFVLFHISNTESSHGQDILKKEQPTKGVSVFWDNIQFGSHKKHQRADKNERV